MDEHWEPALRPPSRERVVDDVRRSLEEAIFTGEMPPGSRLVEQRLSEQLQVSRTTVREALLMLRQQGLVAHTPRGGTFVTRISPQDALDLRTARALLEGYAVRRRVDMLDREIGAELDAAIVAMGRCVLPRAMPRLVDLDLAFHRLIMTRAQSSVLLETWAGLDGLMRAVFLRVIEARQITVDDVVAVHRVLLVGLRSGDADRAQRAIVHHYMRHYHPPEHADAMQRTLAQMPLTER